MSFQLEITHQGSVQSFPFSQDAITLGREKACHLVFDHPTVSRQHAKIVKDPYGTYSLHVLSQSGLTAINGTKVQGVVQLQGGETINLGQMQFVFRPAAPAAHAPSVPVQAAPQQSSWEMEAAAMPPTPAPEPEKPKSAGAWDWDQIDVEDEDDDDAGPQREMTAYEKMQKAQKKGADSSKGTNPLVLVVGVIAIAAIVYMLFFDGGQGAKKKKQAAEEITGGIMLEMVCTSEEECTKEAEARFKLAKRSYENIDVRYENAFQSYKLILEGKNLLKQGDVKTSPSLENAKKLEKILKKRLDAIFRNQKIQFDVSRRDKARAEMYQALDMIRSTFPEKTTREYKWATRKEQELRKKNIKRPR